MAHVFCDYPFPPLAAASYERRSQQTLELALTQVAAYAPWRALDPGSGHTTDRRYAALPVLNKADIRAHFPAGLTPAARDVGEGLRQGDVEFVNTSGTTDERVTNLWNQAWWNASEEASWQLNAHTRQAALGSHREALLTSALSVGLPSDASDLPMAERRLGRFLFLNEKSTPALWTPDLCRRMLAELEAFQPRVLEANPSYLSRLAAFAADHALPVFQPALIVLTFEMPSVLDRRQIDRAFRVPVCSSYGTTEAGYVLMACEHGRLHQNTETCRIDFQPLAAAHGGPAVGRLLVTTFRNPWCVLLRFNTDDLVRLDARGPCPCGRRDGLTVASIEGRAKNLTLTTRGRLVTERQLDEHLGRVAGLIAYELIQGAVGQYRLRCLTGRGFDVAPAAAELRRLYGDDADITVSIETEILPTPSGKFRRARADFPIPVEAYLDSRYA